MRIKVNVGGTDALLTPKQYDALIKILVDVEVIDTNWVGAGKGFYGDGHNSYTADIRTFNVEKDSRGSVMSEFEYDKLYTLCAMRRAETKEE